MPIPSTPYDDPDYIRALYENPADEVLLAEYILQTGAGQAALQAAMNNASGGDSLLEVTEIGGHGGGRDPRDIDPFDTPF